MNDMFWLMTFVESSSFIGSQVVGNWLIGSHEKTSFLAPSSAVVIMAFSALAYVSRGWKEDPKSIILKDYQTKFHTYILGGMSHPFLFPCTFSLRYFVQFVHSYCI